MNGVNVNRKTSSSNTSRPHGWRSGMRSRGAALLAVPVGAGLLAGAFVLPAQAAESTLGAAAQQSGRYFGTAMSNNAVGNFGPPKYEAARFTMPSDGKTLAIELHK